MTEAFALREWRVASAWKVAKGATRRATPFLAILLLLVIWQAATVLLNVPSWLLPKPTEIVAAAWRVRAQLPRHVIATVGTTLIGFTFAVTIGVSIATLLAWSSLIRRIISPMLAGFQAIPKNALAPLMIVWFGGGALSKVAITFLISFFPIVVNTLDGMTRIDRERISLAKTLKATSWQTFIHIRFPNAIPHMLAGCQIAITLAIVGAVIAEFVGSDVGLGYLILVSSSQLNTDVAFVAIAILGLCGFLLFHLVSIVEALVLPALGIPNGGSENADD